MERNEKIINAESIMNTDATLSNILNEFKEGETLVLDIGNNYFNQTDDIYNALESKGYDVKKSFRNGRNQIIINKRPQ
ncbi:hypothetical protein DFR58_12612 [Anaerobacterium chartisolvens]|uniref:Uncharacterized protein n=1 Tax=Anaerobacterium chartisolvens TaxID=1297424 RepID=A0A369APE2_9FIRM|nr:hypothetical protein [Anaerobacterium chartisolvens]RCX11239.1 hypothetical protein DFR58_12612 [Anaerobacterium chartisolvens]